MTRYRKKPIEVEAIQYTGDNGREIADFMHVPVPELQTHVDAVLRTDGDYRQYNHIYIKTPEGTMTANYGDYIIKGVKGEFYPCKPDIFDETYEIAEGEGITEEKSKKFKKSQNLKFCPFCGSTDVRILHHGTHNEHSITCDNCHVWVDHLLDAMSEEEAIELWDRRVKE